MVLFVLYSVVMNRNAKRFPVPLVLTFLVVLTILTVSRVAYRAQKKFADAMVDQTQQQLSTIAVTTAGRLEAFVADHSKSLQSIARNMLSSRVYNSQTLRQTCESGPCRLEGFFDLHSEELISLMLLDEKGVVLFCSPKGHDASEAVGKNISDRPGVAAVLEQHKSYITKPFYDKAGQLALSILEPVNLEAPHARFAGIIERVISIDTLSERFLEPVRFGKNGRAWMFNQEETILSHPNKDVVGLSVSDLIRNMHAQGGHAFDDEALHKHIANDHNHLIKVKQEISGIGASVNYRTGEEEIVAYSRVSIGDERWNLIVSLPLQEISGPINEHAKGLLWLTFWVVVVSAIGAVAFSKSQRRRAQLEAEAKYLKDIAQSANAVRESEQRARELERMVLTKQKMESLGHVAAGIAHEIRNPLSGVNVYLHMLMKVLSNANENSPELLGKCQDYVSQSLSGSRKIELVIKRVMDFSKPSRPILGLVNINTALEDAIELSMVSLKKAGIVLEAHLAHDLLACYADGNMIEQVVLNLINNAAQAMQLLDGPKRIEISSAVTNGSIAIKVSDSGPGVPEHYRDKIFDPFFTTKSDSSGIGLAICHRIVTDHGGSIRVGTSKWGGAEFSIELPHSEHR